MDSNPRNGRLYTRSHDVSARRRPTRESRKPKLIAGLLLFGTVLIGGGGVFAATRPTWTPPPSVASMGKSRSAATMAMGSTSAATSRAHTAAGVSMRTGDDRANGPAAATGSTARPHPAPATASSPAITYTVKSGDTLSGIAEWFKLHGYGELYRANMAVIGGDPNLIFPGQRITISHGKMSMSGGGTGGQGK